MQQTMPTTRADTTADLSSRLAAAAVATLLGAFMLIGVGFAHSDILHNAAHDSRHTFAFPCH
ncbi:MAG: CbtB-domain containing protein [Proteobacteria bacterium]|nr:CbtB-domain containing protein [Pseudomonadota bacterium]